MVDPSAPELRGRRAASTEELHEGRRHILEVARLGVLDVLGGGCEADGTSGIPAKSPFMMNSSR